ncbi:MAG TPA: outer membrane beta-barrel protein [Chlorobiota bacterium]|nr:outer membrane beta-barrel protein [Chlorobiota bacterium]
MICTVTRVSARSPGPDTALQTTIRPWFHTTIMSSVATATPANTAYGWMLQPANARAIEPVLAIAGLQYTSGTLRARIGLQAGTFVEANYLGPDAPLRLLHEAWADIQLFDDLSLKAGVFPSHIGNESMISSECRTLTRSLIADFTPYYESGVVLTWTRGIVSLSALALNGWQRIVDDNGHPAFATNVQGRYGVADRISLAARAEYVNDPQNILFPLVGGSSVFSWSAGIDVQAQTAVKFRGEVRHFTSEAQLWKGNTDGDNIVVTLGMSVDLE